MQASELHDVAEALRIARVDRKPIPPPSKTWPTLDAKSGFEVGRISTDKAVIDGDRLVGYKLGNIAKVMQDASGLDQPDYGSLLASTFIYEGTSVVLDQFIKPFVELEPAFVLRGSLKGPNITAADVINAIDYCLPAIEIVDSRVQDWAMSLPDNLADNSCAATIVLGGTPRPLTELTLSDTKGTLFLDGEEKASGNTRSILGNPINAVAWLVNQLAAYEVKLKPGQIIMPGSCLKAILIDRPGHWMGTFEGFGSVEFDVV